jgi:hypothetical protein
MRATNDIIFFSGMNAMILEPKCEDIEKTRSGACREIDSGHEPARAIGVLAQTHRGHVGSPRRLAPARCRCLKAQIRHSGKDAGIQCHGR